MLRFFACTYGRSPPTVSRCRASGASQRLVVIALGKLGAGELNLSSDVDLIFAYPQAGETRSAARTNQQFFMRLGQRLIQVLDTVTADGFVFRVDMRLRPFGDSGALVLSFDQIERYYEEQGRDWERYAWIRARPCAGDLAAGRRSHRRPEAVRVPPLPRLRRDRGAARDESPDRRRAQPRAMRTT